MSLIYKCLVLSLNLKFHLTSLGFNFLSSKSNRYALVITYYCNLNTSTSSVCTEHFQNWIVLYQLVAFNFGAILKSKFSTWIVLLVDFLKSMFCLRWILLEYFSCHFHFNEVSFTILSLWICVFSIELSLF